MCTCNIFVCRHKNNDMSTLLGHAHTYIPTDRQSDTQAYIHKSIQTYSYTYTWLHMCDVFPLWGGGVGGNQGGLDHIYISCHYFSTWISSTHHLIGGPKYLPLQGLLAKARVRGRNHLSTPPMEGVRFFGFLFSHETKKQPSNSKNSPEKLKKCFHEK